MRSRYLKAVWLMVLEMARRFQCDAFLPPALFPTKRLCSLGDSSNQEKSSHLKGSSYVIGRGMTGYKNFAAADTANGYENIIGEKGQGDDEVRDCVIVGAGIAGLAAAADLERSGLDFVLLEAGDRLGGRIFTHKESRPRYDVERGVIEARPLELGAQWLHGTVGNPLFDFCVKEGIFDSQEGKMELDAAKRMYTAGGFEARRPDGTTVSRKEFIRHSEAWAKAVLEAESLYGSFSLEEEGKEGKEQSNDVDPPQLQVSTALEEPPEATMAQQLPASSSFETVREDSASLVDGVCPDSDSIDVHVSSGITAKGSLDHRVGAFLHRRVREILTAPSRLEGENGGVGTVDEGVLGYLARRQCSIEGCDNLNDVSVEGYGIYEELAGGDVRVPGGFSRVVDALARKISSERVRLKSPVTMIEWGSVGEGDSPTQDRYPCVVQHTITKLSAGKKGGRAEACTRRIRCRRVLVAVGLGVLKDGTAIRFSPPLPPAKLSAIRRLGFGTTDKIFVRCTREADAGGLKLAPHPSMYVGVMRPVDQEQQHSQKQGLEDNDSMSLPPRWIDDIFSFSSEGEYICSWLTGQSAKAAEAAARSRDVTDPFLALLRTTTQDPSWEQSTTGNNLWTLTGVSSPSWATTQAAVVPPPPQVRRETDGMPAGLVRSDWNSNPLFRGSYSYIATGSSEADLEELARPISVPVNHTGETGPVSTGRITGAEETGTAATKYATVGRYWVENGKNKEDTEDAMPGGGGREGGRGGRRSLLSSARVMFAGEAMHPRFFSTAHGGFETGRRAASEVLASIGFRERVNETE